MKETANHRSDYPKTIFSHRSRIVARNSVRGKKNQNQTLLLIVLLAAVLNGSSGKITNFSRLKENEIGFAEEPIHDSREFINEHVSDSGDIRSDAEGSVSVSGDGYCVSCHIAIDHTHYRFNV